MASEPQTIEFAHDCGSVQTTLVPHRMELLQLALVPQRIDDPHAVSLTPTVVPQRIDVPHRIDWFHVSVSVPIFVHGDGVDVSHQCPVDVDVSTVRARSIAPFGLREPAPFLSVGYSMPVASRIPRAVYSRIPLSAFGVIDGCAG